MGTRPDEGGPLRFVVYSDYLCPWCANAAVRLARIEAEFSDRVAFEWKSYLLRPQPRPAPRDDLERAQQLEKFRRYAESWRRPAAEDDAYPFGRRERMWASDEGPPSHSTPAQLVAKAAARLGDEAFHRVHERLLRAYFVENRDISRTETLADLWQGLGLPPGAFEAAGDPALLAAVVADHQEALEFGATGVPAVRLVGNDAVIVGAHPIELYRRWIERTLRGSSEADARGKAQGAVR